MQPNQTFNKILNTLIKFNYWKEYTNIIVKLASFKNPKEISTFVFLTKDGIAYDINIPLSITNKTISNSKTIKILKMVIGLTKELFFSLL